MTKILLLALVCGCATMSNSSRDKRITISTDIAHTKIYHNGRFIGKGSAITYASGHGTDVITAIHNGCMRSTNVRKDVSDEFVMATIGGIAITIIGGLILAIVTMGTDRTVNSAESASVFPSLFYSLAAFAGFSIATDASSGAWRKVDGTHYQLTPLCVDDDDQK